MRFGLAARKDAEAGGTVLLDLHCENVGREPVAVFGFRDGYPRSLRVSPPKSHRPWIRVSFGDVNVLHPPEAFLMVAPGARASTTLDLSFAFDRRGVGEWPVAFAYDRVKVGGRLPAYTPEGASGDAATGIVDLVVSGARSLRDAGIDENAEAELDHALFGDESRLVDAIRQKGPGGVTFAARRVARILSAGAESTVGFHALRALELLGVDGLTAVRAAREELPHAEVALRYAEAWLAHRAGEPPAPGDMPFVTTLERMIDERGIRGNLVVSWQAYHSDFHGTRRLELFGNGERIAVDRPPGVMGTHTRRTRVPDHELDALLRAMRDSAVWIHGPLRELGMPDEPRPTLEIQLALGEPFRRNIVMWNGEWRRGPAAPLAEVLDRLIATAAPDSLLPPA